MELIKDRNKKKNLAKTTRKDEDWNKWKIAKNLVNNRIRNEKLRIEEDKMLEISNDATGRQLWQMVKANAGWLKSLAPKSLMIKGMQVTSPKQMANAINKAFIQKISNICIILGDPTEDPLTILNKAINIKVESRHLNLGKSLQRGPMNLLAN